MFNSSFGVAAVLVSISLASVISPGYALVADDFARAEQNSTVKADGAKASRTGIPASTMAAVGETGGDDFADFGTDEESTESTPAASTPGLATSPVQTKTTEKVSTLSTKVTTSTQESAFTTLPHSTSRTPTTSAAPITPTTPASVETTGKQRATAEPDDPFSGFDDPTVAPEHSTAGASSSATSPQVSLRTDKRLSPTPKPSTSTEASTSTIAPSSGDDSEDPFRDFEDPPAATTAAPPRPPTSQSPSTHRPASGPGGRSAGRAAGGQLPANLATQSTPTVAPPGSSSTAASAKIPQADYGSILDESSGFEKISLEEAIVRGRAAAVETRLGTEPEMFTWLMVLLLLLFSTTAWIWFCCVK